MFILIFLAIFLLINVALLKYCNSIDKMSNSANNYTFKIRRLVSDNELENMRKCVNNNKSKF